MRYLPRETKPASVGWMAGLGVFWSCSRLEIAGAGVVTAGKIAVDGSSFTDLLPTWLGKLTLLAIFIGAICANALNIYSGCAVVHGCLGIRLPTNAQPVQIVAVVLGLSPVMIVAVRTT